MAPAPRHSADAKAQATLESLNRLEPAASRAVQLAALRPALSDRHLLVVARAATLSGERLLHELIPDLLAAFTRFKQDGVKRDPRCRVKNAIARALVALECLDTDFYQQGIRYTQLEPTWGKSEDTATDVRCSCAMGLAASGYGRAVAELTGLLTDPVAIVRCGAVRAIACGNPFEAEAVLRLKVHAGDAEAEVIGECFAALLALQPEASLPFVAVHLAAKDEALQEYAALALGESRRPEALDVLRRAWDDLVDPAARAVLIRAAALHRSPEAFDWLLAIIETGTPKLAAAAADALGVYERNTQLLERLQAAKARRGDLL